ncbi:MAG: aspartate 1-decarboxylase, partial [Candidatus Accumulibacter sp.]|nr:aspartate 1-decarboxylase [Accumulibacter sp.]
ISWNGSAARRASPVDCLIRAILALSNDVELATYSPKRISVDTLNLSVRTAGMIPTQAAA